MRKVGVYQVVFGYRDGHSLLTASEPVDASAARELLPHTDGRFESELVSRFLVGTWISSADRYLLARIWPANEIARPGAVWAHGLLLDKEALSGPLVPWLSTLRRPTQETLEEFAVPPKKPRSNNAERGPQDLVAGLAWATIGAPEQNPVVLWDPVEEGEEAIVTMLDALPASVKKAFSFRTRDRARLSASRYDLQLAASVAGRSRGKDAPVLDLRRGRSLTPPRWATSLAYGQDPSAFGPFIQTYCDRRSESRQSVAGLAAVWSSLEAREPPQQVVHRLIEGFPRPRSASKLRRALVGDAASALDLWPLVDVERLALVAGHEGYFDLEQLRFEDRFVRLWRSEPGLGVHVVSEAEPRKEAFEMAIRTMARSLETPAEIEAVQRDVRLLDAVLVSRPSLLQTAPVVGALTPDAMHRYFVWLRDGIEDDRVVEALCKSGRFDTLEDAAAKAWMPASVLLSALVRAPEQGARSAAAALDLETIRGWLGQVPLDGDRGVAALAVLPWEACAGLAAGVWKDAARNAHARDDPPALSAAVTLTEVASKDPSSGAGCLFAEVFAPLHRALEANRLDHSDWARLELTLPARTDSSPAGRLRQALVDRASREHWSRAQIEHSLQGAGRTAGLARELLPKKHPLRKAFDGVTDLLR